MNIIITHFAVSVAIGFAVFFILAIAAASLWGAYLLAFGGFAKLLPAPVKKDDCPLVGIHGRCWQQH